MQWYEAVGNAVADLIFTLSNLLREDYTPGLVAAILVACLLGAALDLIHRTRQRQRALRWLRGHVEATSDAADFSDRITELHGAINAGGRSGAQSKVRDAWGEYKETFVGHEEGERTIQRNTARPSLFFNLEDLDFGPGYWRILPGLFVTIGLFLTFLGLISALHSMNSAAGVSEAAMTNLLSVASAKFIMSLTGLLCSIVFTVLLRYRTGVVETEVHNVNTSLESRLGFITLEELAVEQLSTIREQREHFRTIGLELVAELGRPLRNSISGSITDAMAPLLEQVNQTSTEGVGELVRDLSARLSEDVDGALGQASARLAEAGDHIGALVQRMDETSGRMGSGMDATVERLGAAVEELRTTMANGAAATTDAFDNGVEAILSAMNDTLVGIRDNTSEGARALSEAAVQLRTASEGIRLELEAAARQGSAAAQQRMRSTGDEVAGAIGSAGTEILRTTAETAQRARQELLQPMQAINEELDALSRALQSGAVEMQRMSDGVRDGANATVEASGSFRSSTEALVQATAPIRAIVESLQSSTNSLASTTGHVADSARSSAESARRVLEAAEEALGGQQRAVQATLAGLNEALERMQGQGERLDDLDTKLGHAFEEYRSRVGEAVDGLFGHVREMQQELDPALGTMREIVEQAESFVPESRHG